jgi:NAD(P)-dependent dehydrogenase (short-subunit alcohol dehydrogenase family)
VAVELGAERIRVNLVVPDTTLSTGNMRALAPETLDAMAALPPEAAGQGLRMYIPLKAAPGQQDLANAVLFLASDLAAFVTGTCLHVDGGTMAASGFLDWPYGDGFPPVPMAGSLSHLYAEQT